MQEIKQEMCQRLQENLAGKWSELRLFSCVWSVRNKQEIGFPAYFVLDSFLIKQEDSLRGAMTLTFIYRVKLWNSCTSGMVGLIDIEVKMKG